MSTRTPTRPRQALLRQLAGSGRLLVVVGDPDQSIYGFRGADVRGIMEFPEAVPARRRQRGARSCSLQVCRRSGPELLAVSRQAATKIPLGGDPAGCNTAHRQLTRGRSRSTGRHRRSSCTRRSPPRSPASPTCCAARISIDEVPWSQMAVLVRSGVRSIPTIRRALVAAGVPVSVAADELPLSRDPAVAPLLQALDLIARAAEARPPR